MAPPLEISIPTTTTSSTDPPFTLYNITLRLPLRTFIVQKRYSDFDALSDTLKALINDPTPVPLPPKSWPLPFLRTKNNPDLVEERRIGLEKWLRAIAEGPDGRWRGTSAWRTFLNLPSNSSFSSSVNSVATLSSTGSGSNRALADAHAYTTSISGLQGGGRNLDAGTWLDVHRELKATLHDARLWLGKRDSASTPQAQHEAGAGAKRCLVKSSGLITTLEEGLEGLKLGEGEMRRRRDLVQSAKVEREGLEKLNVSLAVRDTKYSSESGASTPTNSHAENFKAALFGSAAAPKKGRVLGAKETDRTRELDNAGVLQLQKQIMEEQDLDVEELGKIVRRQKEMGIKISEEIEIQNEMLARLDGDVDRVQGKIKVAGKRAGKIN